jgi:hypothetical protein
MDLSLTMYMTDLEQVKAPNVNASSGITDSNTYLVRIDL